MGMDRDERVRGAGCLSIKTLSLLRGQLISVLIAGTGVFATLLSTAKPNANFPMFMNFLNYLLLSAYFVRRRVQGWGLAATDDDSRGVHEALATSSVSKALRGPSGLDDSSEYEGADRQQRGTAEAAAGAAAGRRGKKISFGWYVLAAALDVSGNYLFIKAYDYTSITSIMLLDCFTIPSAMLLSAAFLQVRYKATHLVGILLCISGLVCIVLSDLRDSASSAAASSQFLGDMMCIVGSFVYAASNVLQEHLVRKGQRVDYMGNLGVCGVALAGVLFLALDLPRMQRTDFSTEDVLSVLGFVGCLFAMYTQTSSFLEQSDAVVFNLSLLTSDVYACVFSFFFYGRIVPWPYWLSYALVCTGLSVYYSIPPALAPEAAAAAAAEQHNPLSVSVSVSVQE